jgi:DNA-binding CsgD family transcriptional regulator
VNVAGVHAELAVDPADACPLDALAEELDLRRFVPGSPTGPAQVVVAPEDDGDPAADASDVDGVRPVIEVETHAICRLDPDECPHDPCLGRGLGFLPVEPFHLRFRDGELSCHLAARDDAEVRECVSALRDAGFDVSLRQLHADALPGDGSIAIVDLDELTERQREVAAYAVANDYGSLDGPAAADVAEDLGITKSTLSAHMRAVRRKIGRQLFD